MIRAGARYAVGAMPRVLDNPRTGERIVIHRGAAETDGQVLEFEVFLQPGAHVPAGHIHPLQQEQFTVLDGQVRFTIGGQATLVGPGSHLIVAPGTSHWFGNAGRDVAHLRVEVRPALEMESLFETSMRCTDSAAEVGWLRLLNWVLIPLDFRSELRVPHIPVGVLTALLSPLAWVRARATPETPRASR
jgi:quercetin dioxygenase-like cupin family protein